MRAISSGMAASSLLLNITSVDASKTRPRKRVRHGDTDLPAISTDKRLRSPLGSSSGLEPKQESKVNKARNESIGLQSFLNKK